MVILERYCPLDLYNTTSQVIQAEQQFIHPETFGRQDLLDIEGAARYLSLFWTREQPCGGSGKASALVCAPA